MWMLDIHFTCNRLMNVCDVLISFIFGYLLYGIYTFPIQDLKVTAEFSSKRGHTVKALLKVQYSL